MMWKPHLILLEGTLEGVKAKTSQGGRCGASRCIQKGCTVECCGHQRPPVTPGARFISLCSPAHTASVGVIKRLLQE